MESYIYINTVFLAINTVFAIIMFTINELVVTVTASKLRVIHRSIEQYRSKVSHHAKLHSSVRIYEFLKGICKVQLVQNMPESKISSNRVVEEFGSLKAFEKQNKLIKLLND